PRPREAGPHPPSGRRWCARQARRVATCRLSGPPENVPSGHAGSRGVPSGWPGRSFAGAAAMQLGRPRLCGLEFGSSVSPRSWVAECVGRAVVLGALEKRVPILRLRPRLEVVKGDVGELTAECRAVEREAD